MNFRTLTQEELHPLSKEFTLFLSTQGIDATLWEQINKGDADKVDKLIKQFSDSVWYKIFFERRYMQWADDIHDYHFDFLANHSIIFKVLRQDEGNVEIAMSEKKYQLTREEDMYQWMLQGAFFSDGQEYKKTSLLWASTR